MKLIELYNDWQQKKAIKDRQWHNDTSFQAEVEDEQLLLAESRYKAAKEATNDLIDLLNAIKEDIDSPDYHGSISLATYNRLSGIINSLNQEHIPKSN